MQKKGAVFGPYVATETEQRRLRAAAAAAEPLLGWLLTSAGAAREKIDRYGETWRTHVGVLAHLSSDRHEAEAAGWTACALERRGPRGTLHLFGVAPGETARREVPASAPLLPPTL